MQTVNIEKSLSFLFFYVDSIWFQSYQQVRTVMIVDKIETSKLFLCLVGPPNKKDFWVR